MFRDFMFFLRALWRQWRVLLTGGSIMALLSLWVLIGREPPFHAVGWLVIGVTLMVAAFLSWRSEWVKAGQDFIEIDFRAIAQSCSGLTEPQTKRFLHHYAGKRMKVVGTLYDISELSGLKPYARVSVIHMTLKNGGTAHFSVTSWNPSFKGIMEFPKGTLMTVAGRVSSVWCLSGHEFAGVSLSGCELVQLAFPGVLMPEASPPPKHDP